MSRVTILITHIRGLITPLITTHEPPSRPAIATPLNPKVRSQNPNFSAPSFRCVSTLSPEDSLAFCSALVILLMDKILHDPKDPTLWELWYIPYNG